MNNGEIFYDLYKIKEIFQQALKEEALLEVCIDSERGSRYGARLVKVPTFKEEEESEDILALFSSQVAQKTALNGAEAKPNEHAEEELYFLSSPLEPSDGNLKVRRSRQVFIWFHAGNLFYGAKVHFRRVEALEGAQTILWSFPNVLRSLVNRTHVRADIPKTVTIPLSVQKRGFKPIPAQLMNISAGGLSFACRSRKPLSLTKGDKLNMTIGGEWGPISAFGTICNQTATRDVNDMQVTIQCYGLQFKMLSVADAMTVDRLVKQFSAKRR